MKNIFFTLLILLGFSYVANARHITGGEIYHEYLGPGSIPNTSQYRITLRLFRDFFSAGAALDATANIGIFDKSNNSSVTGSPFTFPLDHIDILERSGTIPCIVNAPNVKYQVGYYFYVVTLPNNQAGYWISYQRCCRVDGITNLTAPALNIGATYLGSIAGTTTIGTGHNSSPKFYLRDTALVCHNRNFTLDFSASDADGDVLTYELCEAFEGNLYPQTVITSPLPPPYSWVSYGTGFSMVAPLGPGVTINQNTGIISGIAPSAAGSYVIAVCVNEWRNGQIINTHRKDFILKVADCDFVSAQLPIAATFCESLSVSFENLSPSTLIYSWFWDFGVTTILSDTSNVQSPTYTYADTGTYTVKLVVNRGDPCSDSATMQLGLYPNFISNFSSVGICVNRPVLFTDLSTATYGTINSWRWNFGEPIIISDTSILQNPTYTYPTIGVKNVQLIATSSKGCIDTIQKDVTIIDKPPINLAFRDTLICNVDSLRIPVSGNGIFSWTPNYNILFANTNNPLVFPQVTTWYYVELDLNGCKNTDSVRVRVASAVNLTIRPDTTICRGDSVQLNIQTNGLQFLWMPTLGLSNPNIGAPLAFPTTTTLYQLTSSLGICNVKDSIIVRVVPYPSVNAGPDATICFGTSTTLNASMVASSFLWRPQGSLSNPTILNPIASPKQTTSYILQVNDTLGCPKPSFDTVIVNVRPKLNVFAGRDTSIVANQPLQLNATGAFTYLWSPSTGLNNISIGNPIAILSGNFDSIRYKVVGRDIVGCSDSSNLLVKVFRTRPQIFVPSGFTPNGDALNDILKPIAVGMERIEYFKIYNRWGQLVFSTTINGQGWDGKIEGVAQTSNTFVWMAKAIDYTGKPYFQKGTATLIR